MRVVTHPCVVSAAPSPNGMLSFCGIDLLTLNDFDDCSGGSLREATRVASRKDILWLFSVPNGWAVEPYVPASDGSSTRNPPQARGLRRRLSKLAERVSVGRVFVWSGQFEKMPRFATRHTQNPPEGG